MKGLVQESYIEGESPPDGDRKSDLSADSLNRKYTNKNRKVVEREQARGF
jgi:hypothetical protein